MTRMSIRCTVVAIFVVLGTPVLGCACSCMIAPSAPEALAETDEVFTGRVTAVKRPHADAVIQSSMDAVFVTLAVDRVWKGVVGPVVEVATVSGGESCGFDFVDEERYLVFANRRSVSACSRTSVIDRAASDLAALGAGHAPDQTAPPRRPKPTATPGEPDATNLDRCPDGVATITEPFVGFLDLDRLTGTYDMGCEDACTVTRCNVTPREGPVVTRYGNGQIHIRGFYRHGRREGTWDSWYREGQPHYAVVWRHDRPHGLWRIWYGSGHLEAEMEFTDGVPDGDWRFWHANGNPKIEGAHRHGARSGTWRFWDETGQLLTEGPGGPATDEP